ncbi:hypothetical protein K0M31_000233 [Melipona bicolor]|uniref:Ig-like domain-containing protein n=1 Tax=Melipona bicolor TaxID=60889 RepID=A0AA40GD59_9HYME|nr:hypothetical protein K0M31_000233 [Melipona bicolor]
MRTGGNGDDDAVQPAFVRVIDEKTKNTLSTGATLGPINEGSPISLYCESGEGKPVPTVGWFKNDQPLEAISSTTVAENGIGNASSQLQMQITRDELNSTFTCKVNSMALVEPLTVDIKLDVHGSEGKRKENFDLRQYSGGFLELVSSISLLRVRRTIRAWTFEGSFGSVDDGEGKFD